MLDRLELDSHAWRTFVAAMPEATPFHHPAWSTMIARSYGFEAFALALRGPVEADGYVAGLPVIVLRHPVTRRRRWSSLPFTDVCPALVRPADAPLLAGELERRRIREGVRDIAVSGPLPGVPSITSRGRLNHVLALDPDPLVVERRFRASVRRNVRTARASGLQLRRAATESDMVDVFYRLQLMTRRRLGLPAQPRRFFRRLWRDVVSPGLGHLTIVEMGGTPVAAGAFLTWNGVTIYKYGASDPSAWRLRPNNLLFAEEIAEACRTGCSTFHFGRTDVDDEGLRRFKLGWGAEETPLQTTWFGATRYHERSAPPPMLRALIRRSPLIVSRTIGSALYRYVA